MQGHTKASREKPSHKLQYLQMQSHLLMDLDSRSTKNLFTIQRPGTKTKFLIVQQLPTTKLAISNIMNMVFERGETYLVNSHIEI